MNNGQPPPFFFQQQTKMAEVVIKPATADPTELVPLDVVKAHLRVESDDEDVLILSYMSAAMDYMSSVSGRTFKYTSSLPTIYLYMDKNERIAQVRRAKGLSFISARYIAEGGVYKTLDSDAYRYSKEVYPTAVEITDPPSDIDSRSYEGLYRFTFSGGDTVSDLPNQFKIALLMLVGHYYANREAEYVGGITTELKEGVRRLMNTVKRF